MAETIIEHVYHLKGGEQIAVEYANPLLDRREPIVVYCKDGTTRMKIGDGIHHYKDLDWIGGNKKSYQEQIVTFDNHFEFPIPGDETLVYRAKNESVLYQWNNSIYSYEPLVNADVDISVDDIKIINGGRATELLDG